MGFNMDYQLKLWEHTLKKNSKVENAIAVAGFKAALLVGKKQNLLEIFFIYIAGMLSHEEDDSESETESSKFTCSTEINIYVNLHERVNDQENENDAKDTFEKKEAHFKRIFI